MSPRETAEAQEREEEEGGGGGKKATAAAYIPADICEEILYRLSCTHLSELRFVCKDWLRLISSPKFIEKHLERSKAASGCNGTRILTLPRCGIQEYRYAEGNINMISQVPKKSSSDLRILGSCDGLVLFKVGDDNKIALMNPCTGMTDIRDIDLLVRGKIMCSWFGQHPSTREYVLVLVTSEFRGYGKELVINVYSLSGNTINTVSIGVFHVWKISILIGTFLHGRVHFPIRFLRVDERYAISGFDFESNEIFKMKAPTQSYFTLGVVEGCLSAVVPSRVDVGVMEMWIIKEERWSKYVNINVGNRVLFIKPIAYFPNGDVIFGGEDLGYIDERRTGKFVSLYNLKDMETTKQCFESYYTVGTCGATATCVESLVTPAMVWRGRRRNQNYIHTSSTRQLDFATVTARST